MQTHQPQDWLGLLEHIGTLLEDTEPANRVAVFLQNLRDQFRWAVAEYWVLQDAAYRLISECHRHATLLDEFARESAGVLVPREWISRERWASNPEVTVHPGGRSYWLRTAVTSDLVYRHDSMARADLNTLVFIPVPNGSYIQRAIVLRDFPSREAMAEELHALAIAVFLFGRAFPWEQEAVPEWHGQAAPGTHLNPASRALVGPDAKVRLTVYEWDLLSLLFEHVGRAVSFKELTQGVWQAPEEYVGRPPVYEVIARLRRHLAAVSREYRIDSVPRYGYVLEREKVPYD